MSKWIEITDADDVAMSDDGKDIDVLYGFDRDGNKYISIPVAFIPELTRLQAIEKAAREALEKYDATANHIYAWRDFMASIHKTFGIAWDSHN